MPKGVYVRTAQTRRNIGESVKGRRFSWSEEARKNFSHPKEKEHADRIRAVVGKNWSGGSEGDLYASFLCPAGFKREHHLFVGSKRYILDFAHLEGKVNIELDGCFHGNASSTSDEQRDALLHKDGWKVIRIK